MKKQIKLCVVLDMPHAILDSIFWLVYSEKQVYSNRKLGDATVWLVKIRKRFNKGMPT